MRRIAFFDLKGEELSVYSMTKKGNSYRSHEVIHASAKGGDSLINERKFENVEAYLSVPLSLLNFRIIELPFSDRERIREVLSFELDSLILGGSGGAVLDACILGESNGKAKILAVYIMKHALKMILERLKAFKADPRTVSSIELASLLDSSLSEEGVTRLLLDPKPMGEEDRVNVAIKEISNPTINLRRGELSFTADAERIKRGLRFSAILALLLLFVFLSDMAIRIIATQKGIRSVKDEIRKTYTSVFPQAKKITNEVYQMKAHLKELREKERSYIGIYPLHFFLDLTSISRPGLSFMEITIEKERIVFKGECPSLSDVEQIKSDLTGLLTDVNIADAKASSQNRVVFTITAKDRKA